MDIIAITVSTNYSDLLYHALKSNHKYFKHWIFVTDQNDKDTIELLNQYDEEIEEKEPEIILYKNNKEYLNKFKQFMDTMDSY
jgi:hypothetical protein